MQNNKLKYKAAHSKPATCFKKSLQMSKSNSRSEAVPKELCKAKRNKQLHDVIVADEDKDIVKN